MTFLSLCIAFFVGFGVGMLVVLPTLNRAIADQIRDRRAREEALEKLVAMRAVLGELVETAQSWKRRSENWKSICENKYGWKLRGLDPSQLNAGEQDAAAHEEQR
jgi:hypothetical protein